MIFAASIFAAAFFGLNFDPASTNAATQSRIYPVAPSVYRMVQPDGTVRMFEQTDAKEGILVGTKPWIGVVKQNRIDIWADPEYTGGKLRTAFTFVSGRLRLMVLDGVSYTFAKADLRKDGLDSLFPERKSRQYAKNTAADIWRSDTGRLRLWFANPNSAGMLFGELLVLCVWLLTRTKGKARIGAGVAAVAVSYCLLATASRGALAGVAAGLLVIAAAHWRKLFSARVLVLILCGAALFGAGIAVSGKASRLSDAFSLVDAGNARRMKIGVAAVKMFADAPSGWSGGEVPGRNACLNWYVFDEPSSLRTHLMSLAECGWIKGFGYVFFWVFVVAVGFALARKGNPLVAALWTSFGFAGFFNPVYRDWEVWILPAAALLALHPASGRLTLKNWRTVTLASISVSLAAIAALVFAGKSMSRPTRISVRCSGNATLVNGNTPNVWIVGDPLVLGGGGFPGREILPYCLQNQDAPAIAYVYDVNDLPGKAEFVIVAGRNVPDYLNAYNEGKACKASHLLFLSASVGPDCVPERLVGETKLLWIAGSLLADRNASYEGRRDWVRLVPGCERYIPDWTGFMSKRFMDSIQVF